MPDLFFKKALDSDSGNLNCKSTLVVNLVDDFQEVTKSLFSLIVLFVLILSLKDSGIIEQRECKGFDGSENEPGPFHLPAAGIVPRS